MTLGLNRSNTLNNADLPNAFPGASWKLDDPTYLQFQFECVNCTKHPNFPDRGQTVTQNQLNSARVPIPATGTFGCITAARPGIKLQLKSLSR